MIPSQAKEVFINSLEARNFVIEDPLAIAQAEFLASGDYHSYFYGADVLPKTVSGQFAKQADEAFESSIG